MLFPAILNLTALLALAAALVIFTSMRLKKSPRRQALVGSLVVGLVACLGAAALTWGAYIQEKTGLNLHMPAGIHAKARVWLKEHGEQKPERSEVARNIEIIEEGVEFYRQNPESFSHEASAKMEEYAKMPTTIDHVLSVAEEARFHRAAEDVFSMIKALSTDPEEEEK